MEIKFLNWDIYVPKILGGGDNPNNPPYIPTNNEISEMILHFDNLLFLTKILCSSKCFSFFKR